MRDAASGLVKAILFLHDGKRTLASSSFFVLSELASLLLSCCLSAVSSCSWATRFAALALVASSSPAYTSACCHTSSEVETTAETTAEEVETTAETTAAEVETTAEV